MVRACKLTLPLAGRKSKKEACSGAADQEKLFYEIPKPTLNSGRKAHKLLGLPDLGYHHRTQKEEQSVGSLHTKQGVTSVVVSGVSVEPSGNKNEGDHRSANKQKRKEMQQPAGVFQAQPSPPLPKRFMDVSSDWDSLTDATSSHLQHSGSSSTLRSYDDSLKIPLSVPQQTSLSPNRDKTLPKDYSPTSSSPSLDKSGEYTNLTTQSRDGLDRNEGTYLERNPPYLDLSVLFPKSYTSNGLLSSPHNGRGTPISLSIRPDGHRPTPSPRRKWFGLKNTKRKKSRSGAFGTAQLNSDVIRQLQLSSIIAVGRPKDKVQNWFDGLEEEDCVVPARRTNSSEHQFHQAQAPSNVARSSPVPDLSDVGKEDYYLLDRTRHLSICARISSFQQGSIPMQLERLPTHYELHGLEVQSIPSNSTQRNLNARQSCESIFLNNNLQKQSVLALSSLEDDSENEVEPTAEALRRCRRGSVDETVSSGISLHSAQQVAYSQSGPIVTQRARMISQPNRVPDQAIAKNESCLGVLGRSQAKSKFSVSKHQEGSNQGTSCLDLENKIASVDTRSSSPQCYRAILQNRNQDKLQVTGQPRRMIAVTEDEVHQLEAMRLTGTKSKAPDSYSMFPLGKAENGDILGRNAANPDPHTSVYQAEMSNFPSPPSLASTKIYGRSLRTNSTHSLSPNKVVASSSSVDTFIYFTDHVTKPRLSPSVQFDPPLPSPSISMASIMSP